MVAAGHAADPMGGPSVDGRKARSIQVLLVDNDSIARSALRRKLEYRGYGVSACDSAAEALELLAAGRYDALVSEVRMPGMSGLKLLRAVRERDPHLPVILVTGNPDLGSANEATENGASQYLIRPVESERMHEAIERAVAEGRSARAEGQNEEAHERSDHRGTERAGIVATLERAFGSLAVAYQPISNAADGSLFAYEALMRSEEPALPHPSSLLKVAESVDRLPDLGEAMRRLVAQDIATTEQSIFFVNLHPEDLGDDALYEAGAPLTRFAARVVFEITERTSLENVGNLRERIARLRALGFRIALVDDLAATYGGLTSFKQLDPEFVKLDMELVRGIEHNEIKREAVRSMIERCHAKGRRVIAEGVERPEEKHALAELGCDLLQGYLLGRPIKGAPSLPPDKLLDSAG